jgi:DNA polymerase alpha subunit B
MEDDTVDELNGLFAPNSVSGLDPDVLGELQSTLRNHSLPPQELFYIWESYSMKMGLANAQLNFDTVTAFKKNVQEGMDREVRNKTNVRSSDKRGKATPRNVASDGDMFGM